MSDRRSALFGLKALEAAMVLAGVLLLLRRRGRFRNQSVHRSGWLTERVLDQRLQACLVHITDLCCKPSFFEAENGAHLRQLARAYTLATLPQLDSLRKGLLVRFLYEAGLIGGEIEGGEPLLPLHQADLRDVDLRGANLSGANFCGALLDRADLRGAFLGGANLGGADLMGANLSNAALTRANLILADLGGANFRGADLTEAKVLEAQLARAVGLDAPTT